MLNKYSALLLLTILFQANTTNSMNNNNDTGHIHIQEKLPETSFYNHCSKISLEEARKIQLIQFFLKALPPTKPINSKVVTFYQKWYKPVKDKKNCNKKIAHYKRIDGNFLDIIEQTQKKLHPNNIEVHQYEVATPQGEKIQTNIIFKPEKKLLSPHSLCKKFLLLSL